MTVEHRRDKRSHVFLTAFLRAADGQVEVKLTNLSSRGACAAYPVLLAPGTEVHLSRGDVAVPAKIAWSTEGKLGIEFSAPIDVEAFRMQGHMAAPSYSAPVQPVERLSRRMERHWTDIWNN